jgi:signal transduction histidine kinase
MLPPYFLRYGFDPGQSSGLGMRLVNGLVQRLQGELSVSNTGRARGLRSRCRFAPRLGLVSISDAWTFPTAGVIRRGARAPAAAAHSRSIARAARMLGL